MGRTVPSFRMMIDIEVKRVMSNFGMCLHNKNDRERLANLMSLSKRHSHSCSESVRVFPLEAIILAALLERQKMLDILENEPSKLAS